MQEATAKIFSMYWWRSSGGTIALTAFIMYLMYQLPIDWIHPFRQVFGWWVLVWAFLPSIAHRVLGQWHVRYGLPLQLCDVSAFFTAASLLTQNQTLYEIALYWGCTGAFHALLTPQFTQGTQRFFQIEYYVSHSGLLLGPMFLTFICGMSPTEWSWAMASVWLNVAAMVVGSVNWLFNCNYMFLCKPPTAKNPFIIGAWPWYLIGFELAMLLHFVAIYWIFK